MARRALTRAPFGSPIFLNQSSRTPRPCFASRLEAAAPEKCSRVAQDFRANGEVEGLLLADKGAHRGVGNDVAEILGVVNGAAVEHATVHYLPAGASRLIGGTSPWPSSYR